MNNKSIVFIGLLTFILFSTVIGQNQSKVSLGTSETFKITGQKPFIGKYQLLIDKTDVPKAQSRWYLFAMAQPLEQSTQLFGSPFKISFMKGADIIKSCKVIQQSDACFISNNQFDYTRDNLTITIQCDQQCQFQLATQIDYAYPLKMDSPFKLDFKSSAYTKIFTLNTEGKDFYQLRLTLQPRGFINYGQPIVLLANYGNQIPTQLDHDLKGIHTWDDGQGIFVRKSQLRSPILTILVEGPQKNVLELIAKGWQKQEKLVLTEYLPEFDWVKGGQTRQVALTINEKIFNHRVKVVVFTGSIQNLQVFKTDERDSAKLSPVKFSMPAQKYGEFEFRFAKQLIEKENLKNVVIKLTARKDTTYVINYAREQSSITAIFPYVSQSSLMEPGQTDQYYVKVQQLMEATKQKKASKIQLIVGNIQGNVELSFYKCNSVYKTGIDNMKNCQVTSNNIRDFQQIEPVRFQNRGGQKRYWFQISWADHIKRTDKDKAQVVYQMAVLVKNKYTQKTSSYQIQYKNKDRIYLLKQGELTKDRVFINQKRHYKLSIQDKDATEVRIHCTRISGQAFFIGSFVDPRVNKDHEKILPLYSILTLKLNPQQDTSEVFLQVQGVDNAYYSLTTQIIRKSQANPKKNGTSGYNELIVRQGFPYQFLIAPLETIVLQIHATQKLVTINMKSTSAVSICMTQNLKSPPFAPNCEIKNDFFLEMNQKFTMQKGLIGNIGVKNPDTKKNVSIKIMVQNPKSNQKKDESGKQICQIGVMNEVLFKKIGKNGKDSDGDPINCLDYNLNKNQEIELIVDLKGQHLYDQGKITAYINDQEKIRILSPSHIFKKQQVQSACMKRQGNTQNFCYLKVSFQGITDTKVRVLAQYTSQAIRLIDGIAHPVHSQMIKNKPKHFYLGIHNSQNITLYLQNRIGEYKIYANLMPYSIFATKNSPSVYPTKQLKDIQSTNPFYNLQQILIVSSSNISDKCPYGQEKSFGKRWLDCVLLISVYLDGTSEIQNNGKFIIQATQQNRQLKDGNPLSGYLQKKSAAFYHFQNQRQNGTIIIQVNNQNKNCLDIFLRQGSQRATSQYNQKHAKASNILLYNFEKIGTYSITLEANENCPYTITVTSSKNNITKVKKGTFADINLPIDGQKYFIFQNLINQTFKVLSIHKSGQVIISVNPVPRNQILGVLQSDLSTIKSWTWSNKDSVRISSIDRKNGQKTKYCFDCYYLINVKAIRQTQASIVIPTSGSDLPITTDAITQDTLLKDESTTYRIFTQTNSQFEVYVQYGKIQISILESEKDVPSYNKTFQPSKAPILQKFSIPKTQQFDFLRYVKIVIKAHQDSYFSFSIVSSTDPTKRGPGLKYGIPQYIFLESNKQKCVSGTMTVKIDQLLLSFSKSERKNIEKMQIKVKINNRQVTIDKQYGNNEMLLRINALGAQSTENKKFDICLKSMTAVSITLIQSSPLNYWPQKQSILIKKQANLTFGSQGKGIIELNQCQSRASAQLFSQFNDMKNPGSQIKQRRRSNNIIQFYHYGPVYIKAKSQKATLKWISINETSGIGLGYEQYRSGSLRFSKQGNNLVVMAQQIKPIDQKSLSSSITSVKYQFYAASEQMQLFNAMNCGQGIFVKKVIQSSGTQKNNPIFKASFDINNELKPKFGAQKYFLINVKAIVSIKVSNQIQQYRFFYPYQQLNKQLLYTEQNIQPDVIQPDVIQPKDKLDQQNSGFLTLLGYILIAIILFGAVYLVYSKCLKKYLSKKQKQDESLGKQMKYYDLSQH